MTACTALTGQGLAKCFGAKWAVAGADLTIQPGEIVGLFGPNGAGKTTTFLMMAGLLMPDKGRISMRGVNVSQLALYQRARLGLRYLPQEASIFRGMTVGENMMAALEMVGVPRREWSARAEALLEAFSIAHLRHSPAITLSGGQRRRLEIARALVGDPSFLLLDEPLAGIDPRSVREVGMLMRQLASQGLGILVTDHNVKDMLALIDRAYVMENGTILASGSPQEISQDSRVRQASLGSEFVLDLAKDGQPQNKDA
jgi:lipopolysaccharide export system ATP-binding protein